MTAGDSIADAMAASGEAQEAVPSRRGIFGSIGAGVPDFSMAAWLGYLLRMSFRNIPNLDKLAEHWRWWFAYELFSGFAFFVMIVFSAKLVEQRAPDLKGRVLKEGSYWLGLPLLSSHRRVRGDLVAMAKDIHRRDTCRDDVKQTNRGINEQQSQEWCVRGGTEAW